MPAVSTTETSFEPVFVKNARDPPSLPPTPCAAVPTSIVAVTASLSHPT
jgi:hypothetical protein